MEGPRRSRRDVVIRRPSHKHHQTREGEGENLEIWVDTDRANPQRAETRQFVVERQEGKAVAPRRISSGNREGRRVSQHRVTPESRAPSWWSSASRSSGPDRTSGRSLKQAPCSRRSCKEEAESGIGRQARLTRPLLGGCIAPQFVVFHLKPQVLHLAQTAIENFSAGPPQLPIRDK